MQKSYATLRDSIAGTFSPERRRQKKEARAEESSFWALKDISFDIKHGEVVGLIGRNGAGKSTLLKVLSRITEPTLGCADIYGRVGTLLEVGTGFHAELTGRENIFLNGAILGMAKEDIRKNFDEMVAFAEVEKFLDTPVKHYSTGMYLRLAFAVAAHLNPDILLVDEVLAVGDMAFQKKCLGKMDSVAREGRTIVFVSHNMGAVRSLCTRGVVLNGGEVYSSGDISSSIEDYYKLAANIEAERETSIPSKGFGFGPVELTSHNTSTIDKADPFELVVPLHFASPSAGFTMFFTLDDMHQRRVATMRWDSNELSDSSTWHGSYKLNVRVPTLYLEPGLYSVGFKLLMWSGDGSHRHVANTLHLDVGGDSNGYNSVVGPPKQWTLETIETGARVDVETTA
jgi:lipopolysaccharide transport system ATP-binding protein